MSMDLDVLGRKIRTRRIELGLTQRELGELMGYEDYHVSKWERGIISPCILLVPLFKKYLDIDLNKFFSE